MSESTNHSPPMDQIQPIKHLAKEKKIMTSMWGRGNCISEEQVFLYSVIALFVLFVGAELKNLFCDSCVRIEPPLRFLTTLASFRLCELNSKNLFRNRCICCGNSIKPYC